MAKNNKKAAKPVAKVVTKKKSLVAKRPYVLYVLRGGPRHLHAYVGVTYKDPRVRLAMHNGTRSGGAAATKRYRGTWQLHMLVSSFDTYTDARVIEHAAQHPTTPPGAMRAVRLKNGLMPHSAHSERNHTTAF